ncbi:MAG: ArnT family glycosyltransferase [Planctomycetota bacterium]
MSERPIMFDAALALTTGQTPAPPIALATSVRSPTIGDASFTVHERRRLWLLVAFVVPIYSIGLVDRELWTPDEPRVAEISREIGMFEHGYLPRLAAEPFLEQPPLYYAIVKASYLICGGPGPISARLPSALFAFGAAFFAARLARRMFDAHAAWVAFFLMLFNVKWIDIGHKPITDTGLACAVGGAGLALHYAFYSSTTRIARLGWLGFYLCGALAFWFKGLIGMLFPALAFIGVVCWERRFRELLRWRHWAGGLFWVANIAAWALLLWRAQPNGSYLYEFFVHNHLGRFLPSVVDYSLGHKKSSSLYYVTAIPVFCLPATIFIVHAILYHRRRPATPGLSLLIGWFALGIVLLTFAGTKRSLYALPLIAPFAVYVAPCLSAILRRAEVGYGATKVLRVSYLGVACAAVIAPIIAMLYEFFRGREIHLVDAWLALGGATLSMIALTIARRGSLRSAEVSGVLLLSALYACCALPWVRILDSEKSLRPFAERLVEELPAGAALASYSPDETTRAVVPFYTGLFPRVIREPAALLEFLAGPGARYVIYVEKNGVNWVAAGQTDSPDRLGGGFRGFSTLRPAPESLPRLRVVYTHECSDRRQMALFVKVP